MHHNFVNLRIGKYSINFMKLMTFFYNIIALDGLHFASKYGTENSSKQIY